MANTTVRIPGPSPGVATHKIKLYASADLDTVINNSGSGDTATSTSSSMYTCVIDEAATGLHAIVLEDSSGNNLTSGFFIEMLDEAITIDAQDRSTVVITPVSSTVSTGAVSDSDLIAYQHSDASFAFTITDSAGAAVDLSGKTCVMVVYKLDNETIDFETIGSVGGASNNIVTCAPTATDHADAVVRRYILRNTTDDDTLAIGGYTIIKAPDAT